MSINRDITSGEELLTSYIPKDLPVEDRREMLWDNWGFWCTCPRCVREEQESLKLDAESIKSIE